MTAQMNDSFDRSRALNSRRIPLWLKLAYTAFMAVLIPVYWVNYGPSNFLYFCDTALILTLVGVWREDALLISMPAVGIVVPQIVWLVDYASNFAGHPITGLTDYMFDQTKSRFLRGLSLFHGWLPIMLVYLIWCVGYDRRAFAAWTVLAWGLQLICYFLMSPPLPDPGNAAVNINYVFGMSDTAPQAWMPPLAWLGLLMVGFPVIFFAPAHFMFSRWKAAGTHPPSSRHSG